MKTTKISLLGPSAIVLAIGGVAGLAQADKPAPAPPPAPAAAKPGLDPSHVICGDQYKPDPRSKLPPLKQCADAAAAFYAEEWQPQVQGLLAGKPDGLAALRPATTFSLPDGTMVAGAMIGAYAPTMFGANAVGVTEITPDFTFKPVDHDTILVFGTPKFTLKGRDGSTYVVVSAQLSVYRRTRPGATGRGWEELGEFWSYKNENKGPMPQLPPPGTAPAAPAKPAK